MELGTIVAALAAFSPIVYKFVDWVKFIVNKEINGIVTQASSWVGGIVVAWLAANSDFANGTALDNINGATIVLAGLSLGSVASGLYDFKKARDGSDSATVPPMLARVAKRRAKASATRQA